MFRRFSLLRSPRKGGGSVGVRSEQSSLRSSVSSVETEILFQTERTDTLPIKTEQPPPTPRHASGTISKQSQVVSSDIYKEIDEIIELYRNLDEKVENREENGRKSLQTFMDALRALDENAYEEEVLSYYDTASEYSEDVPYASYETLPFISRLTPSIKSSKSDSASNSTTTTIPSRASLKYSRTIPTIPYENTSVGEKVIILEEGRMHSAVEDEYIAQTFINIEQAVHQWVDKYARGRCPLFSEMPQGAKQLFLRLSPKFITDPDARFKNQESRIIMIRQMLAHTLMDCIFKRFLFALDLRKEQWILSVAEELDLSPTKDAKTYKQWESKFAQEETAATEYQENFGHQVGILSTRLYHHMQPFLPGAQNIDSPKSRGRISELREIIIRCGLLHVVLKKRLQIYDFDFLTDLDARRKEYRSEAKEGEGGRIEIVVWPAMIVRKVGEAGVVLVKAKVQLSEIKSDSLSRKAKNKAMSHLSL